MVTSIDEHRPDDELEPAMREPAEDTEATRQPGDRNTADPYADMELRHRHERTERVIQHARDLG